MHKLAFSSTCAALLGVCSATQAATIASSVGGVPTGVKHLNFDDLTPGSTGSMVSTGPEGSISVGISPNGQVAIGAQSGIYAAPYLSGLNGEGFASQMGSGADTTPYLTTGRTSDGGAVTLTFGSDQQYLGLLWGSVDNYNTLKFFDAANNLVDTVVGNDVLASPNGDQGINGTLYVNINTAKPFRYAVATSSEFAFEFDNVAYNTSPVRISAPDSGSSLGLLGIGFVGVTAIYRRKSRS